MRPLQLENRRFGALTVLHRVHIPRGGRRKNTIWHCVCDCGNEKDIAADVLVRKKDAVRSCGCKATLRGKRNPLWKGHGEISGNWWYNHVLRRREKNIEVSVTPEYMWKLFLKQRRQCFLSGMDLLIHNERRHNTASVDRIDPKKGYIEGNVQWVHKDVNFMKWTHGQFYFIGMCKRVSERLAHITTEQAFRKEFAKTLREVVMEELQNLKNEGQLPQPCEVA